MTLIKTNGPSGLIIASSWKWIYFKPSVNNKLLKPSVNNKLVPWIENPKISVKHNIYYACDLNIYLVFFSHKSTVTPASKVLTACCIGKNNNTRTYCAGRVL